jgi:8-oxo-dGTP pyrophosphatase MutT (NUDIX family)
MRAHPPFWSFPKGHPERGDTSEVHTAIREVGEETGIVVKEDGILFKDAEGLTERYRNPGAGLGEGSKVLDRRCGRTERVKVRPAGGRTR